METATVLVTGANGFIGSALAQRFRAQGMRVIGVDLQGDGDRVIAGDIGTAGPWQDRLAEAQIVVHTAALVTNGLDDAQMWRVNVLATRNLVAAAARYRVRRFVHVSSIVAYGNVASGEIDEEYPVHAEGGSYVRTKLAAEHVVLAAHAQHGLEVVILRPGDVYGPGCRPWVIAPLELIRARRFLLPASGRGCFRPLYVDDLTRGIALAATNPAAAGQIINLSCEGCVTTREFFAHHHRWLNRSGPPCLPAPFDWLLAEANYRTLKLFGINSEVSGASVGQLSSPGWFSIRKAASLLGWTPEVSLADGMQRTQDWARSQGLLGDR